MESDGKWMLLAPLTLTLTCDARRAAALFGAAAALGDPPAQLWLGHAQRVGGVAGVRRDPAAGRRLLELSAGAGHGPALLYLARLHRCVRGGQLAPL